MSLREKVSGIGRSEFLKNVLTIFSGNVIAQAIPFLIEPVIARIYSPEDFAVLAVYLSIANLFSIIATGRYEMAVMLPEKDKKAVNVIALSLLISLAVSAVSFLVVWIFNSQICNILENQDVSSYLYLVPVSVLSVGWFQTFNYWNSRKKRFKNVTYSKTTQSVTVSGASIGMGYAGMRPSGLILSQIIGQFFALFPLLFSFLKKDRGLVKEVSKSEIKAVAVEYQDFPKINSLHAFSDVLRNSGTVFLLSHFFTQAQVGQHSKTIRLLFGPLSMIASAVGQVFYQKAASCYQSGGDLQKLVKKVVLGLAAISLPMFLVVVFFGPELFAWFLGENWRVAGEYGRLLAPWVFLNFVTSPVSQIPIVVNRQKAAFLINIVGHTLFLLSIAAGGVIGDIRLGFIFVSITQSIFLAFLIFWIINICKKRTNDGTGCKQ